MKAKTLSGYIICAVSGVLTALAFTISHLSFLCFFSVVPLYYVFLDSDDRTFSAKVLFVFNIFYYIPLTLWLYELYPLTAFGMDNYTSFVVLTLGILLIGFTESLFMYIAFLPMNSIWGRIHFLDKKPIKIIIFSLLYILGESFQEIAGNIAFPWGRLGVIVFEFRPFVQSCSLFGTLFISFILLLINGFLALAILNFIKNKNCRIKYSALYGGIALAIFSTNLIYGICKISIAGNSECNIDVAVVQGNLSSTDKWQATVEETLELYKNLSETVVTPETNILIWPETAIPTILTQDIINEINILTSKHNIMLITGFFETVRGERNYLQYNAMKAMFADGSCSTSYYKQKLVPFGEYFPVSRFLSSELNSNLTAGAEANLINTEYGKIGGLICYESIFPKIVRRSVNEGAELIVLLSNDSWFGTSPAIRQHFGQAVLRAIESGRYVIRAGNTGISAIISPTGNIYATTPFIPTAFTSKVKFINKRTLYSILGDIILIPSYAIFLFGIFSFFKKRKKLVGNKISQ